MSTKMKDKKQTILLFLIMTILVTLFSTCALPANSKIKEIKSNKEFAKALKGAGEKLVVIDLYANWCMPCKVLSPMLEQIGEEHADKVTIYKVEVDKSPELVDKFDVTGIPFVVFFKDGNIVQAITGLRLKDDYVRIINQFSKAGKEKPIIRPNGKLVDGVRIINLEPGSILSNIYVYRGEQVKLKIDKVPFTFSIHIPDFKVSREVNKGEDLEIKFKAKKKGVFPVFCNGDCPASEGTSQGSIIVMQYEAEGKASFREFTARQAKRLIEEKRPLILDVRTPREYYSSHLEGAKLIPLSQLEKRLSEIEDHKDSQILVYCRSGNRSTVAAEILIKNGFNKIINMRYGILDWKRNGLKVLPSALGDSRD